MLMVTMSVPGEDREAISKLCSDIGGVVKSVPLAGTEIAVVGPTLGRHHMPHPICDIAEELRRYGSVTVVMWLARGRGKATSQISAEEKAIIDAAEKKGLKTVVELGEAAFYGPKLDFMVKDAIGRRWQLGTIQVDYNLPERFELEFTDADGSKKRPVMIHRAPFGSLERFTAVVLEHTAGHLPLWLSPDQVKVLPISEKYEEYAEKVCELLKNSEIRASIDARNETLGKRIREISLLRVPVIAIVGEKEATEGTVSVRREGVDQGSMSAEQFVEYLKAAQAEELKN